MANIKIMGFGVCGPRGVIGGYQRFERKCCLNLYSKSNFKCNPKVGGGALQPLPEGYQSTGSQLKRIIHSKFHLKISKDKDKHKDMTKVR
jgi:hypothetical protein